MRALGFVVVGGMAVASAACRDPTQITLALSTDVSCSQVGVTAVMVGAPDQVEGAAPVTTTSGCADSPRIGSLVLVPSEGDDAALGVKVALAVDDGTGADPAECLTPAFGPHCIVARRSLRFIPHTPLTLPVELDSSCQGKFCTEDTTCFKGACVDKVVDPNDCTTTDGCRPDLSVGGGGGEGGAGGGGGAGGAEPTCGPPLDSAEVTLENSGANTQRSALGMAVDVERCEFAIVWLESMQSCVQRFGADGAEVGSPVCRTSAASPDRADLAFVSSGRYAVGTWSSNGPRSQLWLTDADAATPALAVDNVVSGALAMTPEGLLMINESTSGALGFRLYTASPDLALADQAPYPTLLGTRPDVVWSGGDLTLAWTTLSRAQDSIAHVLRMPYTGPPGNVATFTTPANSDVAVAASGDLAGFFFVDSGEDAELFTWVHGAGAAAASGLAVNDYAPDTNNVGIAALSSGWVVSFTVGGVPYLASYDLEMLVVHPQQAIAAHANALAVGAAGEQLAVAWLDAQSTIHFRLVDASGAALNGL